VELRAQSETRTEVHKYPWFAAPAVAFLALVLHGFLPRYIPQAALLDLPLLITLYFGLSRRNPTTGLLLGMTIGLVQDGLSGPRVPIGLYGIAKTIVGYFASTLSGKLDVDHPISRVLIAFFAWYVHQGALVLTSRLLLGEPLDFFTLRGLLGAAVNAVLTLVLFPLLDRFRLAQ